MFTLTPPFSMNTRPRLKFGDIPHVQRNLLTAARYDVLSADYDKQARSLEDLDARWADLAADHFSAEAKKAEDKTRHYVDEAAKDPKIIDYLERCEEYNQQPVTTELKDKKIVLKKELTLSPDEELRAVYGEESIPKLSQSLIDFYSTKNPLMKDRSWAEYMASRLETYVHAYVRQYAPLDVRTLTVLDFFNKSLGLPKRSTGLLEWTLEALDRHFPKGD